MAKLTYHGHSTFTIETDAGARLVLDPFFDENPHNDLTTDDVEADFILCTHGHFDHFADCLPLAERTGAQVISTFEIISYLQSKGLENVHPLHIGGGAEFGFGYAKMTAALHGGQVAGDDTGAFTTVPGGFLVHVDGTRVYHAGDTALLMDMKLLEGKVDVALLPIGDNFTMGPEDAAIAVDFIRPRVVVPIHYGTWPPIEQDPERFVELVGDLAKVEVMAPGSSYDL